MLKRVMALSVSLTALALLLPATPASACVLGCSNSNIVVSPHGGSAGSYLHGTTVELTWQITNEGSTVADVAVLAGATGCAKKVAPYVSPSELVLDAGETATVTTYVSSQCIGAGTAYASAGQDQGYRSISFY